VSEFDFTDSFRLQMDRQLSSHFLLRKLLTAAAMDCFRISDLCCPLTGSEGLGMLFTGSEARGTKDNFTADECGGNDA
jgi:hypothetical protein